PAAPGVVGNRVVGRIGVLAVDVGVLSEEEEHQLVRAGEPHAPRGVEVVEPTHDRGSAIESAYMLGIEPPVPSHPRMRFTNPAFTRSPTIVMARRRLHSRAVAMSL